MPVKPSENAPTEPSLDAAGRRPGHELYGEPAPPSRKVYRLPPMGQPTRLPRTELARQAVMDGRDPAAVLARKFQPSMEAQPGDVPPEGTPQGQVEGRSAGSTLPVVSASRSIPDTGSLWADLLETGRILNPPYDPWLLVCAVDESDTLPQCVDVMARNIGGHGVRMVPTFPARDPETGAKVDPPPEAEAERQALELWLAGLNVPHGLVGLMDLADRDTETVGWGCLEVLRDQAGRVADLTHLPGYTIRLGPEHRPVLVDRTVRVPSTGELVTVQRWARFRLYAQVKEGRTVWFKAFGDPRHVNWKTGEVRPADAAPWGVDRHGNSLEATELVYSRIYHPATPYGVPRWLGAIPHVKAARSAAELLVDWFDNAPIGVFLAWIAGGRWKDGALNALQDQINHAARGATNAWNVVGLEGDSGESSRDPLDETRDAPARAGLEPLDASLPSELYQGRDSLLGQAPGRVRAMFRLGGIWFGDSEAESNRAAADTARTIGEEQVFRPLRAARWEAILNGQILTGMAINHWRLELEGVETAEDTEGLGKALSSMVQGGGVSPNALARLYSELAGQDVELLDEPWADRPLSLTMALLAQGMDPNLPLAELAEEARQRAEAMQEAIASGGGEDGPPGGGGDDDTDTDTDDDTDDGPTTKGLARKAETVRELLDLRKALSSELRLEGQSTMAETLDALPTSWTDAG